VVVVGEVDVEGDGETDVEVDVVVVDMVGAAVDGAGTDVVAPVVAPASSTGVAVVASDDSESADGPRLSTVVLHAATTGMIAAIQILVRRVIT